jgi:hypothetical protein
MPFSHGIAFIHDQNARGDRNQPIVDEKRLFEGR